MGGVSGCVRQSNCFLLPSGQQIKDHIRQVALCSAFTTNIAEPIPFAVNVTSIRRLPIAALHPYQGGGLDQQRAEGVEAAGAVAGFASQVGSAAVVVRPLTTTSKAFCPAPLRHCEPHGIDEAASGAAVYSTKADIVFGGYPQERPLLLICAIVLIRPSPRNIEPPLPAP